MKFGPTPVRACEGAILAHGIRNTSASSTSATPSLSFKKGRILSRDDIEQLVQANIETIYAAIPEPGDIPENEAAARLAQALPCKGAIRIGPSLTGRCNLYAQEDGIFTLSAGPVDKLNTVDEAITLATLAGYTRVRKGQMLATIKIIPFTCRAESLEKACKQAGHIRLCVHPFRPMRATLIMTQTQAVPEKGLDRLYQRLERRLAALGAVITTQHRLPHTPEAVEKALGDSDVGTDLVLLAGASAISDRRDVLPAAIEKAGGTVEHFGMPVDPGNLLLLASLRGIPVLGLPGCIRSPRLNGADWVLERLAAGLTPRAADIQRMGVGGLLDEIATRPQPRDVTGDKSPPSGPTQKKRARIGAIILAAGQSRRMGSLNKLLVPVAGKPMLRHIFDALHGAKINDLIAVTGYQRLETEALLPAQCTVVFNPDYDEGLSRSLRVGIRRAEKAGWEAALVCLGDMPGISSGLISQMTDAFAEAGEDAICVPVYKGKRGNPVLWSARFFDALTHIEGDVGGKALLGQFEEAVFPVAVSTRAILEDIDTPAALTEQHKKQ